MTPDSGDPVKVEAWLCLAALLTVASVTALSAPLLSRMVVGTRASLDGANEGT